MLSFPVAAIGISNNTDSIDSEGNTYVYESVVKTNSASATSVDNTTNDVITGESVSKNTETELSCSQPWDGSSKSTKLDGAGTEDDPFILSSASDFKFFADQVNSNSKTYNATNVYYQLKVNLDLNNHPWTPVGSSEENAFCGNFDGCNHEIVNVSIEVPELDADKTAYAGLFGVVSGKISNLGAEGKIETSKTIDSSADVGLFAGKVTGSGSIENCFVNGSIIMNVSNYTGSPLTRPDVITLYYIPNELNYTNVNGQGVIIDLTALENASHNVKKTLTIKGDVSAVLIKGDRLELTNFDIVIEANNTFDFLLAFEGVSKVSGKSSECGISSTISCNCSRNIFIQQNSRGFLYIEGGEDCKGISCAGDVYLKGGSISVKGFGYTYNRYCNAIDSAGADGRNGQTAISAKTVWVDVTGYDSEQGTVSFETSHLSDYIIELGDDIDLITANSNIKSANLIIGQDLTILYKAVISEGYEDSAYMIFTRDGVNTIVRDHSYDSTTGRYVFKYEGIATQYMADNICASLYVVIDGKDTCVSTIENYSVRTYCNNRFSKVDDDMKHLLADMLEYGAQAQLVTGHNTDNLANNLSWVDEYKTKEFNAPGSDMKVTVPCTDSNNKILSASLILNYVNRLNFKIQSDDAEEIYVRVLKNGAEIKNVLLSSIENENGVYTVSTDGIKATGYADIYNVSLVRNGEVIHQIEYSANSFVSRKYTDSQNGEMIKAMYNYGVSALYYYNKTKGQEN